MFAAIPTSDEINDIWLNKMSRNPCIQGMSMTYDKDKNQLVLIRIFENDFDFKQFVQDPILLPKDEGRYI
jgi:hypothetical protein